MPFELWREDDPGNRFLMESFETEEEALEMQAIFEKKGHRQLYEVIKRED